MSDFRGYIANCLIGCDEVTRIDGGGWIRNQMNLQLGGFDLELIQHADVISNSPSEFQGQPTHTTDVIVRNVDEPQIPLLEEVLEDLSWLLSLSSLSSVQYFGYEYPYGTGYGRRTRVDEGANWFIPIIPIRNGKAVKEFLHQVYLPFRKIKKTRRIPEAIHCLLEAERTSVIEIELLIVFATLEGLKDTYAQAKNIPYKKGYFRKTPKPTKGDDRYTFTELLDKMLRDCGMRRCLKRIVSLRNEIIHSGISILSFSSQSTLCERTHDIIREYLLRLLGYKGSYCSHSTKIKSIQ